MARENCGKLLESRVAQTPLLHLLQVTSIIRILNFIATKRVSFLLQSTSFVSSPFPCKSPGCPKITWITRNCLMDHWARISVSTRRSCLMGTRVLIWYPWGVSSWTVPLVPGARSQLLAYSNILTRLLNTQWWVWEWWLKLARAPTKDLSLPGSPRGTNYPWGNLLVRNFPTGTTHIARLKNTSNTYYLHVDISCRIVFSRGKALHQLQNKFRKISSLVPPKHHSIVF